ncbi:MAG: CBS domain-containing protein, partial [Desulfuromusa sp.]|nr:CBS domain-containing protein [Desulfuromusa sp.]
MEESFRIKDFMNPKPVMVKPDTSIAEIVKLTLKHKVSGVIVVDKANKLLGMISELDCLREMSGSIYHEGRNASSLSAKDIMTKDV